MNTFDLILHDSYQHLQFQQVESFVGEDATGSFGICARHARFMTALVMGLARFRLQDQEWQYIATPGAMLYFHDNQLTLSTRQFFIDSDYTRISQALDQQLLQEEVGLQAQKRSLRQMEEQVLKRLWEMERAGI